MTNRIYVCLGSNIDKEKNMPAAVALLRRLSRVLALSPVYESQPAEHADRPRFFNLAVLVETELDAGSFKRQVLSEIERQLKRRRSQDKNAPRTIDADIILVNQDVLEYDGRPVPDPDLLRFAHVAVPIADLAPDMRHPLTGEPLREIAARLMAQATECGRKPAPLWLRPDVNLEA